ncbi:hypothetical protein CAEBREN_11986 [Caenorhabditis brenneri]|uniref:Uncharacterized protein n=1 Tax=Caenorhabditis brenneri TaxID=135651 RepID=G0MUY5_CAEBE|nr:hypothetical protein CAEBREN_11986 [Caenorhabditis brenneri]
MDPKVYRAYSLAGSTKPDDVKEVDAQLAREEVLYISQGVPSEQFLAHCNQKFPLDESSVMKLLEIAEKHGAPVTLRRCEHFLLNNSRRTMEEKMEIAERYHLQILKTEMAKLAALRQPDDLQFQGLPFPIDTNPIDINLQQMLQAAPLMTAEDQSHAQAIQELLTHLEKETTKQVFIESSEGLKVYLGQIGDPECEAKLSRYLELARNTDSVPRYFSPVVLQSDDPNFVPPVLPLKDEQGDKKEGEKKKEKVVDVVQIDD